MASRYDRAVTAFSLNRHLLHVRYAQEAVREGSTAVIVNGSGVIVLTVQKKYVVKLQHIVDCIHTRHSSEWLILYVRQIPLV
jgi:20S proteasome, alpha and beta subunits